MLVDPDDWSLASESEEVIADMPAALAGRVSLETHAAVMEVKTGVHDRVPDAVAELAGIRHAVTGSLAEHGLRAAVAGTHPTAVWADTVVSSQRRYQDIAESTRVLARREPTLALHVHVGIPTADDAVRVLNGMRAHLPLLLALSANSPFWQARPTGFASTRTTLFDAFPRTGVPRAFRDYADWVKSVELLVRAFAIPNPSFLWWDVRLQPRYGTVEVRILDAQTAVEDVAALVALVQSLAYVELEGSLERRVAHEVIEENRFLAARDGMDARLIDPHSGGRIAALDELSRTLSVALGHAYRLGCERELVSLWRLAERNGAARQLAHAHKGDLRGVTAALAHAYSPEDAFAPERQLLQAA